MLLHGSEEDLKYLLRRKYNLQHCPLDFALLQPRFTDMVYNVCIRSSMSAIEYCHHNIRHREPLPSGTNQGA
jgi:hypothetical protein